MRKVRRTVFLDTTENVVNVVREEPLCIQHGLDHARDGAERHVFCMRMTIPLCRN